MTGIEESVPWLTTVDDLTRRIDSRREGAEVVVTSPPAFIPESPCSLGEAIRAALNGPTAGFNALVGYFGHNDLDDTAGDSGDDPAAIIQREGNEELRLGCRRSGPAGFRLAFGSLAPNARSAQMALRTWYWICRWGQSEAHAAHANHWWQAVADAADALRGEPDGFTRLAAELLSPRPALGLIPLAVLWSDIGVPLRSGVAASGAQDRRLFQEWREGLKGWVVPRPSDPPRRLATAAQLVTFFALRRADIRVGAPPSMAVHETLFHAKLYVIERDRGAGASDAVVVVGSGNWSRAAFSASSPGRSGNTEVATLHLVLDHGWGGPTVGSAGHDVLGANLVATARRLFERCQVLCGWQAPCARAVDLERWIALPEGAVDTARRDRPKEVLDAVAPAATALRRMIAKTLGIDLSGSALRLQAHLHSEGGRRFAGVSPASYQIDGALRLLDLLDREAPLHGAGDPARQGRGAFLTDEAGLGKTLIAQLAAFQLICDRLADRVERSAERPLRVTYMAPKQLAGTDSPAGDPRGWRRCADDVDREVRDALGPRLMAAGIGDPTRWLDDHLVQRVVSVSSVSRTYVRDGVLLPEVVEELLHLAQSEIVVVDESHNLRNAGSRKSRIVRFLLSLPVPGEAWTAEAVRAPSSGDARRVVLCLSATPFNNQLDDLVTQVGHFATVQDWSETLLRRRDPVRQLDLGFDGAMTLKEAVSAWAATDTPMDQRRVAFELLLRQVVEHVDGIRALDWADAEKRDDQKSQRVQDGGPEYVWGPGYQRLRNDWPPIRELLKGSTDSASAATEAVSRLDSVLSSLFVQRSRARILRAVDLTTARSLFRAPDRPRMPLPLNTWNDAARQRAGFEAGVLRQLFTLSGRVEGAADLAAPLGGPMSGLTLLVYRLSALRGRETAGAGGSDLQAARNAFGFQLVFLVKRLQSSPYAFLRTVVRGVLRSTLRLLCAVGSLPRESVAAVHLPLLDAARPAVDAIAAHVQALTEGPVLAGLLGGVFEPAAGDFLSGLIGARTGPEAQRVSEWTEPLRAALAAPALPEWTASLLTDLGRALGGSDLCRDVTVCLEWVFGHGSTVSRGLYHDIYPTGVSDVPDRFRTFAELRRGLGSGHWQDRQDVGLWAEWLRQRLRRDDRLRALVAWAAVQAFAREVHDGDPGALKALLPGGQKTLVFSEYTDTIHYVTVALLAVGLVTASESAGGLVADLRDAMRDTVGLLAGEVDRIRRQPTPDGHVVPADFVPPVVPADLLRLLEAPDATAPGGGLRAALAGLCRVSATCTGEGEHLLVPRFEPGPPTEGQIELDDTEAGREAPDVVIDEGDVLDAFSPHYQIAPPAVRSDAAPVGPEKSLDYCRRLTRAVGRPVHLLLATQVLAEGVNLQESGVVVHYDLPWNPTSLIQRNGRVDRRLNSAYEVDIQRTEVLDAHFAAAGIAPSRLTRPRFIVPEQVYQLTLVPPEPDVDTGDAAADAKVAGYVEAVRRTLLGKLKSIRTLFGLSSWPVVLRAEEARLVLSGQLEFETPAFRRREELFRQWRQLEAWALAADRRDEVDGRRGTVVVDGMREAAADLEREMGPVVAGGVLTEPRDVGVLIWTPWQEGPLMPCRSGLEWKGRNAITGWLHDRDGSVVAFGRSDSVSNTGRDQALWTRYGLGRADKAPWPAGPVLDPEAALPRDLVASPTGLAEELLRFVCDRLLAQPETFEYRMIENLAWPSSFGLLPAPATEDAHPAGVGRWLPWVVKGDVPSRRWSRLGEPFRRLADVPPGHWNLWLSFEEGANG